ncbi:MAG: UUP1 family membrane protein, partial [Leptolyngbya sp. SIO4C5]|nr:UUP1 family membrane protein [Leptolyngbya sp. SIO4C5]
MNRTFRAALLALFLAAIGLTIFIHKLVVSDIPLLPNQTNKGWYIEAKLSLTSEQSLLSSEEGLPTNIRLPLPQQSPRYAIVDEAFVNDGYSREIETAANSFERTAIFQNQSATGQTTLFYRAVVDEDPNLSLGPETSGPADGSLSGQRLVKQQISQFEPSGNVQDNLQENPPTAEIESLLAEAQIESSDRLSLAKVIYQLALVPDDVRVQSLQKVLGFNASTPEIAAFLLQQANIPARVGNGILLTAEEAYSTSFVQWLEVQTEAGEWLAYDTIDLSFGEQTRYLPWWYGTGEVVSATGSGDITFEVIVRPNVDGGLTQTVLQGERLNSPFLDYSLLGLPLTTQRVFQVLVLVPIGALIISVLHQMVGLQTFGTFTPILIALSFRETGLAVGIPLFILVVVIGLLIRAYLNRLQLLIVPRLAAILTATVLIMAVLAVVMDRFQINLGLSISLFPIVILAMTIERAAVMWEEEGAKEVLVAGCGSLAVAVVGYFCMINNYVQHIAFVFPELLLLVLAVNIMVGRYNGYKIVEYFRFRSLQRQINQPQG